MRVYRDLVRGEIDGYHKVLHVMPRVQVYALHDPENSPAETAKGQCYMP